MKPAAAILAALVLAGCSTPAVEREIDRQLAQGVTRQCEQSPDAAKRLAEALQPHLNLGDILAGGLADAVIDLVKQYWTHGTLGSVLMAIAVRYGIKRRNGRPKPKRRTTRRKGRGVA